MANDRLLRTRGNRWVAGVCGGIADHFGWDPDLLRLVWVILTLCTAFCGGIIYLVLWVIMPEE